MPRVSIHGTTKTFVIKENEILYDSLYDRGEVLPHGCLSGSCGACRVDVIEGKDNLIPAGVIETNTVDAIIEEYGPEFCKGKNIRLSCRAKVTGDVVILPIKSPK
ncbi:MAG TPA: 2Fe-2S iron-sulfur cluster-binding protein [Bacteriovoracaceae bacterium]|nr:2Fe-2S iron-sulfur cluster-binding protein [Bacteriovoracaceae bacterium]